MASDMVRFAARFYQERATLLLREPLAWRRQAFVIGGLAGLPLLCLPLVGAMMHFVEEARFNRALLFDLVAHPGSAHVSRTTLPEAA